MTSEEVFEQLQAELESAPQSYKDEDWYKEGIQAAQERIIKEYFENNKIADPE